MAQRLGLGNIINGSFKAGSIPLASKNPSRNFETVFTTTTDPAHVEQAVYAAKSALKSWSYLNPSQRRAYFIKLKASFIKHEEALAQAISEEMGKIKSEALLEAKSLSARIDLMLEHGISRVAPESLYDLRSETRYHPQGALAVIGPYNFPAHLVNAHVIPSLLLGNTVVVKPSEVCPWVGELYASCFIEAGFPEGVFSMVQGDGSIGKALSLHPLLDGILFTGSYPTGRALQESLLDQPHKILALELGGKNFCVVMDDADLEQASLEIIQGAFLTTGQRCTATSRVLIHEKIYPQMAHILTALTKQLKPDMVHNNGLFGPLATAQALHKFEHGLERARKEGAQVLCESQILNSGAFVTPSVYAVAPEHQINGYLSEELFGPNIALEPFSTLEHAITRINQSPYGLSNSIFTLDQAHFDQLYHETKSGILNHNRSTNGALGQMPFGGVGKSGNQRAAGIDAVRYATFPVATTTLAYGETQAPWSLKKLYQETDTPRLSPEMVSLGHSIEKIFEAVGIYSDNSSGTKLIYLCRSFAHLGAKCEEFFQSIKKIYGTACIIDTTRIAFLIDTIANPQKSLTELEQLIDRYSGQVGLSLARHIPLKISIPKNMEIPRSRTMLDRLYRGHFVPKEKKTPVVDLQRSRGAFLATVDDDPLILFDAASQIATLGAGFGADTFQNAYDQGLFDQHLLENIDLSQIIEKSSEATEDAKKAKSDFEQFLHEQSHHRFQSIGYGSSGAEANEMAFDICRQHGPGGTRIIAFEGAFHGRTIMALQATYNKEKRGPFMFKGFEATFVPFPKLNTVDAQPNIDGDLLKALYRGEWPAIASGDDLLNRELASLRLIKEEIEKGGICAVIIEPMQCEGGDQYASNRFFNYLRALTRGLKTPLIFDEVQTGFHLGRTFFWHHQFNLVDCHNKPETPDCVTLGKKAQLGVMLSVWPQKRTFTPHVIQLKRGLLHAHAILPKMAHKIEAKAKQELHRLEQYFPEFISNSRACGFAFAFDMPSSALANDLINQRFERGFMAYIAGEKTLRFRLNMATSDEIIHALFEKLFIALVDMREGHSFKRTALAKVSGEKNDPVISDVQVHELTKDNFDHYVHAIEAIEDAAYEEGRRDSMATLRHWLHYQDSLGLVLVCRINGEQTVAGYVIGGPLEHSKIDGPNHDPLRKKQYTFYSANVTIDEKVRGRGLGTRLKNEQICRVKTLKDAHGNPRYQFLAGRNRLDKAMAMTHINEQLGAYTVAVYEHQYGSEDAAALYYRLPLNKTKHLIELPAKSQELDCRNSIQKPFSSPPASLIEDLTHNHLRALCGSKLTLSNWATPNLVRYSELLRTVMPKHLSHTYFTSGRDEVVDKGLRSVRYHRLQADIVIGFSHQWFGTISAAARSLSHAAGQAEPFAWFSWPHVPHPGIVGHEQSLLALKDILERTPHEKILAIVVELVGEKSGLSFDASYLAELDKIRDLTGIPLIFQETASSLKRGGHSVFLSDTLAAKPNMVWWYTGGQLGHIFVDDQYFVEKPLTLISTWDGDELSIARSYHHLLFAHLLHAPGLNTFEQQLKTLVPPHCHRGQGLWHAVKLPHMTAFDAARQLKEQGILTSVGFDDWLMLCPKPDLSQEEMNMVHQGVKKLF